jgi:membrane protein implicated in regulation of membrane protease activity
MDTATVVFLIIGTVGVLILLAGLLGLDGFDLDLPVPVEAVAAALGGFGFSAAIMSATLGAATPLPLLAATATGAAVAMPAGWLALRLARAASRMATDATPTRDDLLGLIGTVVTPIPAQGYGEVRVTLGGQPVKLNAGADIDIPRGAEVFVITAPSETSVLVEPLSTDPNRQPPS